VQTPSQSSSAETGAGTASRANPAVFVTTHWSVVLAARDRSSPFSDAALETLCRTYWHPLYGYARGLGNSPQDAEDLTQSFFARLLEKEYLKAVTRERGRFRSFLLMAFKRFLANEWDRERALKRGGGRVTQPLDTRIGEQACQHDNQEGATPEKAYDRRWALTLLERTLATLRSEFEQEGKAGQYACLKDFLTAERSAISYAEVAARLGTSEGAARVAVHRLRRRFREVYREEVAHTVMDPEEVDDEIRYLRAALTG
jgi:RNA polymerase sigma-70 factor (ECF subfamily)